MGRRVLVTRAAGSASTLAAELARLGLDPVVVPAIEIAPPASYAALDEFIARLEEVDWLLFTSANGVSAFCARRQQRRPALAWPAHLRVAVIGQATARAAGACGLPVHLLPPQAVAESFAAALAPFTRHPDGRPSRMLLVRAEEGREVLPEALRAQGATVDVVPAYRNVVPAGSVDRLRSLLASERSVPAAMTFTSASTVQNLVGLCEAAGVPFPTTALRISIGPVTSEALRAAGLPPDAEAPEATVAALAEALRKALDEGTGRT